MARWDSIRILPKKNNYKLRINVTLGNARAAPLALGRRHYTLAGKVSGAARARPALALAIALSAGAGMMARR